MSVYSSQTPGRRARRGLGAALAFAALTLSAGCYHAAEKPAPKAPAVVATPAITGEVTDYQDFTGRLDAYLSVEIRSRVSGYIDKAPFKEGDMVKGPRLGPLGVLEEGDLLFQIDPRPYEAQFASAEAKVKAAEAQTGVSEANLENARTTFDRAMRAREAASGLERDQLRAQQDAMSASLTLAKANVGTARADRDMARLNLEWTKVTAPLSGRVSRRNVDPGNLVKSDDTVLTTIVQDDKMYCYFDVDERTYLDLVGAGSHSKGSWLFGLKYPVLMRLASEDDYTHVGTINFLDNRLNGNSGTIRMRGLFENPHGAFKSGLFARVRLPVGAPYRAVLVPDEALVSDQGRKCVYVVEKEKLKRKNNRTGAEEEVVVDVAKYRTVKPGQAINGLRVIKEGLKEGERVVVIGTQRVRQDLPVAPTELPDDKKPKAPESRLTKLLLGYRPVLERAPRAAAGGTDKAVKPAAGKPGGAVTEAGGGE